MEIVMESHGILRPQKSTNPPCAITSLIGLSSLTVKALKLKALVCDYLLLDSHHLRVLLYNIIILLVRPHLSNHFSWCDSLTMQIS